MDSINILISTRWDVIKSYPSYHSFIDEHTKLREPAAYTIKPFYQSHKAINKIHALYLYKYIGS